MTGMASSIPTVASALLDLLEAATWPAPTPQISDSDPSDEEREVVIVGDTFAEGEDDQQWAALGNRARDERYAMRLQVKVIGPGLSVSEARERAFELFAVIEQTLIANPEVGVASTPNLQITQAHLRQPTHRQGAVDEGNGCVIDSAVRVVARLKR